MRLHRQVSLTAALLQDRYIHVCVGSRVYSLQTYVGAHYTMGLVAVYVVV